VVDEYDFCIFPVGNQKRKRSEIERWYSARHINGDQKEGNKNKEIKNKGNTVKT
jgi:hypothetical protein